MKRKIFLITFLFVCISCHLFSQQFYFKKYQVEAGLSHNSVRCVLQDSFGFIWLGTGNGLNRFDGYNFKVYKNNSKDKSALRNNSIWSLYEDENKNIWIGTSKGIFILNLSTETFTPFLKTTKYDVLISSEVKKIIKSKNGLIWISTLGQGLFIYNPQTDELIQKSKETAFSWDISEDVSGRVYVSSLQDGLICFDQSGKYIESFTSFIDNEKKEDYRINSIYCADNMIWFTTGSNKLHSLNTKTSEIKNYINKESSVGSVRCIAKYTETQLLIGADNGLCIFDMPSGRFTRVGSLSDNRGLSDQSIYSILKDKEGGYWISTSLGGINYLAQQTKNFDYYYPSFTPTRIIGKVINDFSEDTNRNIWIGSQEGLRVLDHKTQELSQFSPGGKDFKYDIRALLFDGDDLWTGTFGNGLKIINLKNNTISEFYHRREIQNSLCSNDILSLYRGRNNIIYIGTSWGLCQYNRETNDFTTLNYVGSMISVLSMLEDSKDDLWIGTANSGLFRYNLKNGHWIHYPTLRTEQGELNSNSVISIFEDSTGKVWIGTDGGGLCSYNPQKNIFEDFDPSDSILSSKVICSIEEDNNGYMWLSTNSGLIRVNPKNKKDHKIFTQENGLQSNQFNPKSSLKGSNEKLYFGGINGFNAFYPNDFKENSYIPPVYIVDFRLYKKGDAGHASKLESNTPTYMLKNITLPFDQNNFVLQFAALSYEDTPRNRFSYRLDGFDNEWIYTNINSASYANLPPGKYTFYVRASNNDGVWNKTGTSIEIIITPPWWRSAVAYLVYILISLAIIHFLIKYTIKRTNRKIKRTIEDFNIAKEKEVYQSKINFFVNLVHEIRTPLSLIQLPLERVLDTMDPNDKSSPYLSVVNKNVSYLLSVVNQLLDFQKIENTKSQLMLAEENVNKLLQEIYNQFQYNLSLRSIVLDLQLPVEEEVLLVDKNLITKIIVNLLSNAMKFANSKIEMKLEYTDRQFIISVSDDGKGISDIEKSKIFEAFYQIDRTHSGTGIGLTYSKLLAESHHGTLSVENNKTGGATFKLSILINRQNEAILNDSENVVIDEIGSENSGRKFKTCRVLLVEDNIELIDMMSDILSEYFTIFKSYNGEEAMDILENESIDLVVSDVMMPNVGGLELCRKIKSNINICHIPVILLTAKVNIEARIDGMENGADAYIEKPFSIKFLRMQIVNLFKLRLSFQQMVASLPLQVPNHVVVSNKDQEFLAKLQTNIEKYMSEPNFSIDDLASIMYMSRSNFYRKIKGVSGMAPNDYLKVVRLNKAAELLINEECRIADVYVQVGFSSSSYFAKCFKAQFGVLPKDYVNTPDWKKR